MRCVRWSPVRVAWGLLLLAGASTEAAAYTIGGPGAAISTASTQWSWDGGVNTAPFRAALENPVYFGPAGVVPETIQTVDLATVDATSLAGVDGFISTWWRTDQSAPYDQAAVDFFLGGGDLWLLQDSVNRDGIGELLGIPTVGQTLITPVSGTAPLFDGPFGTASNITQGGGEEGYVSEADVLAQGGTIVGRNTENLVIAAVWNPGQYAPGAGTLIVVADIDMFTTQATFSPLDQNGIFALNAFSFLATSVPEPSRAVLLFAVAGGAAGAVRRRRQRA